MNGPSISRCSKKQVQDEVNKLRKRLTTKMNEEFHLKPIINEIEDRIISLTRITLTQANGFGITKTELLTI